MAEIRRFPFIRHLRTDAISHVMHYRGSRLLRSGPGVGFWFNPMRDSIAEVSIDNHELSLVAHGRSSDFQDVTAQGIVTFRAANPEALAQRVDFSIDLHSGLWRGEPLAKVELMLSQVAQEFALNHIAQYSVRELLTAGITPLRDAVDRGLRSTAAIEAMGLHIETVRIIAVRPSADLEKAIEAPTREHIKQEADEAAYSRRAMAVEKERAIGENEMQNKIELAKREELLLAQQGTNARRAAEDAADATRIASTAEANRIATVEGARAQLERERLTMLHDVPPAVLLALAAQEFAGKIERIDHVNVSPDMLGTFINDFLLRRAS